MFGWPFCGGAVKNTLKEGGIEKETKILKRVGKLGQGVGVLKRGGVGTPITNYKLALSDNYQFFDLADCVYYDHSLTYISIGYDDVFPFC